MEFLKSLGMRGVGLVGICIVAFVMLILSSHLVENLDAEHIMVIQDPVDGQMHWYTAPGIEGQWFGRVTKYPRRATYEFEEDGKAVQFNDGGHATLRGSIQYEYPYMDLKTMNEIHLNYASPDAVEAALVRKTVDKAIYLTGPLMSSTESYAEKKGYLLSYVDDQVAHGVYRTRQKDITSKDPITGVERTVRAVEIVMDDKGLPMRQERSTLEHFGIKTFNFSIAQVEYDKKVEDAIQNQQRAMMEVQTSIANSKKAEQEAITVEAQGRAQAAKAKWDQEVVKATEVTKAEQQKQVAEMQAARQLEVAKLDTQTAEQEKTAAILRAEGEAEASRKKLQANGALELKIEAYKSVNGMWSEAFAKVQQPLVPGFVMGGGGAGSASSVGSAQAFMELMTAKAAKDLQLNINMTEK